MGTSNAGRGWGAIFAVAMAVAVVAPAHARMKLVDPGEVPELDPDEGLVLVAVDTNVPLHSVKVIKDGKIFGPGVLRRLDPGLSYRLYIAPAGTYEWREIELVKRFRYELEDDPEFDFKVEPGRITYAGDLLFRPVTLWRAEIAVPNRSLAALDWLAREHPAVLAGHAFAYSGHYPDPFPAFYLEALARHPGYEAPASLDLEAPPAPGPLPIPVDTLWRPGRITDIALNPSGTLLAMQLRLDPEDHEATLGEKETWAVDLVDIEAGSISRIAMNALAYESLQWSGDDALLVTMDLFGEHSVGVVRAPRGADGKRSISYWTIDTDGVVLDPLPDDPDHILFQHVTDDGDLRVHRVDISSEAAIGDFKPRMRNRLNVGVDDDVQWFTDADGALRLAITVRDGEYVLMQGRDGAFQDVLVLTDELGFVPVGISHDASLIYGLTDEDRGQRDLVVYDIAARRITGTLFSRPGVDVTSVIYGDRRRPIGVTHYEQGQLVSTYFDEADQHIAELLEEAFPGQTVAVVDRSRDGSRSVLWVDAGNQPSRLYYLDAVAGRAMLLEESRPWLADYAFAPTMVVPFEGSDGLAMEAFLTLPEGEGRRPLVVMPHGGPIGVADRRHFDPEVQFLASQGYAVLRINFRGSEGYGRAFREAGYRSWGTLIEDDIDAAIGQVLARHPVDGDRMCVVGASYGGYSALVAAARWPDRFRCVVSIAGVSDRILLFSASDGARNEEGREELEKLMGDPEVDLAAMQETSPLYRHEAIRVPVMLVHGREDTRVDFEHARRIARMFDLSGRSVTGLVFDEEGHGVTDEANVRALWEGVAGFLRTHLAATPVQASADAGASANDG